MNAARMQKTVGAAAEQQQQQQQVTLHMCSHVLTATHFLRFCTTFAGAAAAAAASAHPPDVLTPMVVERLTAAFPITLTRFWAEEGGAGGDEEGGRHILGLHW